MEERTGGAGVVTGEVSADGVEAGVLAALFVALRFLSNAASLAAVAVSLLAAGLPGLVCDDASEDSETPIGVPIGSRLENLFQNEFTLDPFVITNATNAAASNTAAIANGRSVSGPTGFATRRRCHVAGIPSLRAIASRRSTEARQSCNCWVMTTGSSGRSSGLVAAICVISRLIFLGTPLNLFIAAAICAPANGFPGALNGATPVSNDQSVQPSE